MTESGHATRIGAWHVATLVGHAPRFRFRCECGAKGPERGHRFQAAQDEADHRDEVADRG